MPHSKSLGSGLFELRIVGAVHFRFIYAFFQGKAWVLHGFGKKTNRIPQQDMTYARSQLKRLLQ